MTAKIIQNVTPRRSVIVTRPRAPRVQRYQFKMRQRGSINSATLTLGLSIVIIVGLAGLGFVYLGEVFNTASHSSDIQALEEKVIDLREEQRTLELEGARLRSIETIEERVNDLKLVETDKVTYLGSDTIDRVARAGE